jgi:hypothetical protein
MQHAGAINQTNVQSLLRRERYAVAQWMSVRWRAQDSCALTADWLGEALDWVVAASGRISIDPKSDWEYGSAHNDC